MDTILGLPVNRFITFIKPLLNVVAGGAAAWLVAKVNVIGVLGLTHDEIQTQVAAALAALVTTGLLQLGDLKWIKGHHIELANGAIEVHEDDEIDAAEEDVDQPEIASGELTVDDPSSVPADEGDSGQLGPAPVTAHEADPPTA